MRGRRRELMIDFQRPPMATRTTLVSRARIASTLALPLVMLAVMVALSACGTRDRYGQCRDYEPLVLCDLDQEYVCEETADGCDQCSCVAPDEAKRMRVGAR